MNRFDDYRLIKGLDQPDPIVIYDRPDNLVDNKNHLVVQDTDSIDLTYFNGVLKADLKDGYLQFTNLPAFSLIGNKFSTQGTSSPIILNPNSLLYNNGSSITSYDISTFISDLVSENVGNSLRVDNTGKLYVYQTGGGGTSTGSLQEVTQVGNTTTIPIITAGLRLNSGFLGANSPQLYFGSSNNTYIHESNSLLKFESTKNGITSSFNISNETQGSSISLNNNGNFIKIISGGSTEKTSIQYRINNVSSGGSLGHEFYGNVSFKNNGDPGIGKIPVGTDSNGNWIWSEVQLTGDYVTLVGDQNDIRGEKTWKNSHYWDFNTSRYQINGVYSLSSDLHGNNAYNDFISNVNVRHVYSGNTFSIRKGTTGSNSSIKLHVTDNGIYDTRETVPNTWVSLSGANKEKTRLTRVQDVEQMISTAVSDLNQTIVNAINDYDLKSHQQFAFPTASVLWEVNHTMNSSRPSVTLTDLNGEEFLAKITYVSNSFIRINMDTPMSGYVILN